jgi:hypothetical protein
MVKHCRFQSCVPFDHSTLVHVISAFTPHRAYHRQLIMFLSEDRSTHSFQLLGLKKIIVALVEAYDDQSFPLPSKNTATDFATEWKSFMKSFGKKLGLKGKALFHPTRLALTG